MVTSPASESTTLSIYMWPWVETEMSPPAVSCCNVAAPVREESVMLPPDESTSPTSVTVPAASTVTAVAARILFTVTGPAVATTSTAPPSALSDCVSAPRSIAPARLFTEMSPAFDVTGFNSSRIEPASTVTSVPARIAFPPVGAAARAEAPLIPVIVTTGTSPTA